MSKAKRKPHSVMRVDDAVVHCIAMNTGSPTGRFRDSMGYDMLLQRTYAEQQRRAGEAGARLSASSSPPSPIPDSDQE